MLAVQVGGSYAWTITVREMQGEGKEMIAILAYMGKGRSMASLDYSACRASPSGRYSACYASKGQKRI